MFFNSNRDKYQPYWLINRGRCYSKVRRLLLLSFYRQNKSVSSLGWPCKFFLFHGLSVVFQTLIACASEFMFQRQLCDEFFGFLFSENLYLTKSFFFLISVRLARQLSKECWLFIDFVKLCIWITLGLCRICVWRAILDHNWFAQFIEFVKLFLKELFLLEWLLSLQDISHTLLLKFC